MVDIEKGPCGNEDCDTCYPMARWKVQTVTVRRISHKREIKAATAEDALRTYAAGTAWPEGYDESTLEILERHEPVVTQITDEALLEFHRRHGCWHAPED